jgi:hypothetical protein
MDGTTEPIIAVIGHPIAGNPSQFAVERALRSLQLDWRVLSFDVKPGDVAAALDGFAVTGIAGVVIDPSIMEEASRWYLGKLQAAAEPEAGAGGQEQPLPPPTLQIDCLYRDSLDNLLGSHEQRAWVDQQVARHAGEQCLWLGGSLRGAPLSPEPFAAEPAGSPPDPQSVASAGLIVIAPDAAELSLEAEEWPQDDGSTMIIDFTRGHPELPAIRERGYGVVNQLERRIGTLQGCLKRWTGAEASAEVIRDAIEEYLGV